MVGLAVLSALHLSQARDVRRLRAWAGRAPERSGPGRALVLAGLLVLAAAAVYGVTRPAGDSKPQRSAAAVNPRAVTVAVLNGTTVTGLAARLRDRIAAAGYKKGRIDVFSDQQLAESVVQYVPGHQAEAEAVGRRVAISLREPVTADSRALAGGATVVVIAGADKAP